MDEKFIEYYNSVSKTYEFELKKDYNRNGKILTAGIKIPTTKDGIEWFITNGYGDPEKIKVKKEKKTKKAQKEQE